MAYVPESFNHLSRSSLISDNHIRVADSVTSIT